MSRKCLQVSLVSALVLLAVHLYVGRFFVQYISVTDSMRHLSNLGQTVRKIFSQQQSPTFGKPMPRINSSHNLNAGRISSPKFTKEPNEDTKTSFWQRMSMTSTPTLDSTTTKFHLDLNTTNINNTTPTMDSSTGVANTSQNTSTPTPALEPSISKTPSLSLLLDSTNNSKSTPKLDSKTTKHTQAIDSSKFSTKLTFTPPSISTSTPILFPLLPIVEVPGANCSALFHNSRSAQAEALAYQTSHPVPQYNMSAALRLAADCGRFRSERRYLMDVSEEEKEFPLAFTIMMYKDVDQVERLLRAIYRPHNYYCIHVDKKADQEVRRTIVAIATCLHNVFISSRSVDVQWGGFSVLEPQFVCMEDLWRFSDWRYYLNLAGDEFPLVTNLDRVNICRALNGTNDIAYSLDKKWKYRTEYVFHGTHKTKKRKPPPPVNVTIGKGSYFITASRAFVDYVLHDDRALKFRDWVKDTEIPDETFFQSLQASPQLGVPGADVKGRGNQGYITRYVVWSKTKCKGKQVHTVCVFGVRDLPNIVTERKLFVNKFHRDFHPLAYDCMEQWYWDRVRGQYQGVEGSTVDVGLYVRS